MALLQASIGAVNDVVDEPLDRTQKRGKPLPSGLVSPRQARTWAALAAGLGVALSAPSGPGTIAVAVAGVGLGYLYDLGLSRTALSWLPLTLALPLVPIYAWLGASGVIPPGLIALVPAALLAGAALTIGNGLVDVERDAPVGKATIAVRIGRDRAWPVHAFAFLIAVAMAVLLVPGVPSALPPDGSPGGSPGGSAGGVSAAALELLRVVRSIGIPIGVAAIALGAGLLRGRHANVRERGWELEVIGTAVLGLSWLAGTAATASGGAGA
jgi:4-hydroxybenzoate polyprenyltransferase